MQNVTTRAAWVEKSTSEASGFAPGTSAMTVESGRTFFVQSVQTPTVEVMPLAKSVI